MAQLAQDMEVVRVDVVAIAFLPGAKAEDEPVPVWRRMSAHQAAGEEDRAGR